MVEGARLESVYTATYRGFESLPLRHLYSIGRPRRPFFMAAKKGKSNVKFALVISLRHNKKTTPKIKVDKKSGVRVRKPARRRLQQRTASLNLLQSVTYVNKLLTLFIFMPCAVAIG